MPVPGKILAFPSVRPLLISLAVQVPIFGALGFGIGRSPKPAIISGMTILFAFAMALALPAPWFLSIAGIAGPTLIWLSYRRWCRMQV
jgi:hypothetical protein